MPLIRSQIIKQLSTSRDGEIRPRRLSCDMSAAPPSSEPARSERVNPKVLMFHGTLFKFVNYFGCRQLNSGRRFGDGGGGGESGQIGTPTVG